MNLHEPGTRQGDVEALHDMRVATRRMRAALRVFSEFLDSKDMRPFAADLGKIGRILGSVRDLDVFRQKTEPFFAPQTADTPERDASALWQAWEQTYSVARQTMLEYLDDPEYRQFKTAFARFLREPGAGARSLYSRKHPVVPHKLRHVIPIVVYRRWANIRAYDDVIAGPDVAIETLHQLRIDCKRLRYTLEFFQAVLGRNAQKMIEALKQIQDHLGDLQDTQVAVETVREYFQAELPSDVEAYLDHRRAEQQTLLQDFRKRGKRLSLPI